MKRILGTNKNIEKIGKKGKEEQEGDDGECSEARAAEGLLVRKRPLVDACEMRELQSSRVRIRGIF